MGGFKGNGTAAIRFGGSNRRTLFSRAESETMDSLPPGVAVTTHDGAGACLEGAAGLARLLGIARTDVLGRRVDEILAFVDPCVECSLEGALNDAVLVRDRVRLRQPGRGAVWLELVGRREEGSVSHRFHVTWLDVTVERDCVTRADAPLDPDLTDWLVAGVGHRHANIAALVLGQAYRLRSMFDLEADALGLLSLIEAATRDAARCASNVLDLLRENISPAPLGAVVRQAAALVDTKSRNVAVEVEVSDPEPDLKIDPVDLVRWLVLASRAALDGMDGNGILILAARLTDDAGAVVSVLADRPGQALDIAWPESRLRRAALSLAAHQEPVEGSQPGIHLTWAAD